MLVLPILFTGCAEEDIERMDEAYYFFNVQEGMTELELPIVSEVDTTKPVTLLLDKNSIAKDVELREVNERSMIVRLHEYIDVFNGVGYTGTDGHAYQVDTAVYHFQKIDMPWVSNQYDLRITGSHSEYGQADFRGTYTLNTKSSSIDFDFELPHTIGVNSETGFMTRKANQYQQCEADIILKPENKQKDRRLRIEALLIAEYATGEKRIVGKERIGFFRSDLSETRLASIGNRGAALHEGRQVSRYLHALFGLDPYAYTAQVTREDGSKDQPVHARVQMQDDAEEWTVRTSFNTPLAIADRQGRLTYMEQFRSKGGGRGEDFVHYTNAAPDELESNRWFASFKKSPYNALMALIELGDYIEVVYPAPEQPENTELVRHVVQYGDDSELSQYRVEAVVDKVNEQVVQLTIEPEDIHSADGEITPFTMDISIDWSNQ